MGQMLNIHEAENENVQCGFLANLQFVTSLVLQLGTLLSVTTWLSQSLQQNILASMTSM